jgi:spore maturation protein CgeB
MKIIVPNFPAPDTFAENVTATLRAMGHEVITPRVSDLPLTRNRWATAARELARVAFSGNLLTAQERWLRRIYRNSRADMMLCLTQAIREEMLEDVRKVGIRRVAWWGDPAANMKGMGLLSDQWDLILLKEEAAVRKFKSVGLNAHLLHEAMNPVWHRKCFNAIGEQVVVAGNFYGFRQFLVLRLLADGVPVALYGPRPPRWSNPVISKCHTCIFITKEEKSRTFGEGLACLNSTSLSEGNSINCRAFEIAGAGGLHLFEDKSAITECFEPDKEVLLYRSVDDILQYLDRARQEPAWAMAIREAAWRRANAEHTYEHRLRTIFALL